MPNPFDVGYYKSDELRAMGFAAVGEDVSIARNCAIVGLKNISLGSHVRIDGFCTLTATSQPMKIGSHIHLGTSCLLLGGNGITLDDFTGLSHGVKVFTSNDDFSGKTLTNPTVPGRFKDVQHGAVHLKRHVIVGAGSVILPGVTIEEGTAIGALTLVKRSLPAWSIYAGYPAKLLGPRSKELLEMEKSLLKENET